VYTALPARILYAQTDIYQPLEVERTTRHTITRCGTLPAVAERP
jgi:hypothetical protein